MEKKNYQKPAVQVINIGTVAIMQGSTETIPKAIPLRILHSQMRMDGFGLISQPTALS